MLVVVTGSSGRLGRSVCAGLAASGHTVVGADRAPAALDGVDERTIDLLDEHDAQRLMDELRPDAVVHLAGIAVPFSAPEREILVTNTSLAHTVLGAAAQAGVGRVLAAQQPHGDRLQRAGVARGIRAHRRDAPRAPGARLRAVEARHRGDGAHVLAHRATGRSAPSGRAT